MAKTMRYIKYPHGLVICEPKIPSDFARGKFMDCLAQMIRETRSALGHSGLSFAIIQFELVHVQSGERL